MLTKLFISRFVPPEPGHPGRDPEPERTVCGEKPPGGRWVRTCTYVTIPAGDDSSIVVGRGPRLPETRYVCTSRWVANPPTGEVVCTTYPEQTYIPPSPYVPGYIETSDNPGWNAGANSKDTVEGSADLQFSGVGDVVGAAIGLTTDRSRVGRLDRLEHALYFHSTANGPRVVVTESGQVRSAAAPYSAADSWRIRRETGRVVYSRNGADFYQSRAPSSGELTAGAALYSSGDTAPNASEGCFWTDLVNSIQGCDDAPPAPEPTTGLLDTSFAPVGLVGVNPLVVKIVVTPDDKILVAGEFWEVNGEPRSKIARFNSDGTLDYTFGDTGLQTVTAQNVATFSMLPQPDGKILVAGVMTAAGGQPRRGMVLLNTDGSVDPGFQTPSTFPLSSGPAVVLDDGKILVCAIISSVGGVYRLTTNGDIDEGFHTEAIVGDIWAMSVLPDGKILIGGIFTSVGGVARQRLARLNADGTLDPTFSLSASSDVNFIVQQPDGKILIGGNFTTVGGAAHMRIARLNADGTLDPTFSSELTSRIRTMALQPDGKIIVADTSVSRPGDVVIRKVVRLMPDGDVDDSFSAFQFSDSGGVTSLALQSTGMLIVGGSFRSVAGTPWFNIARLK